MAVQPRPAEPSRVADEFACAAVGAACEVRRARGPGLRESHDAAALCIEPAKRGLPFTLQQPVARRYGGRSMRPGRRHPVVGASVVVERKFADSLSPVHGAPVSACPRRTGLPRGLPVEFNVPRLEDGLKRIALTR